MKIGMIGSGATGSVFASFLRLGGAELYLVDRYREHMDKVASDGMEFRIPIKGQVHHLHGFHTAYTAESIGIMDAVIILVKTTDTEDALRTALGCMDDNTVVITLQNGFGNELVLNKYIPADRIMYGSGLVGTELNAPGVCTGKPGEGVNVHFGAMACSARTTQVGNLLKAAFDKGGCPASFDEDIRFFVWNKALANSMANAVLGLVRLPAGYMEDENVDWIRRSILREGCDVANALGIDGERIWSLQKDYVVPPAMKNYFSSTAQDLLIYKRQTEIDSLNGAIVSYGRLVGVPTPVNETVARLVKAMQAHYDALYA